MLLWCRKDKPECLRPRLPPAPSPPFAAPPRQPLPPTTTTGHGRPRRRPWSIQTPRWITGCCGDAPGCSAARRPGCFGGVGRGGRGTSGREAQPLHAMSTLIIDVSVFVLDEVDCLLERGFRD
uniref:Uncharacterized protein n=1 Tax=Triticum urartu TaxID=4572 RepID=A0A8R7UHG3_TRIUA